MAGGARAETKDGKEVEGLSEEAWEWIIKGMRVKEENYDEIIKCYKKAAIIDPSSALPYRFLGIAYHKEGMFDKAISAYRKAVAIEINPTKARFNLGLPYLKKGMLDAAISEYKEVITSPQSGELGGCEPPQGWPGNLFIR